MEFLTSVRWSPYIVGVGIGVLSWLSFFFSEKPIACSTSFAKTGGMIERLFGGEKTAQKPYYKKIGLGIDWQWMLVAGIVVGSFVASQLSGDFEPEWVPSKWAHAFGGSRVLRIAGAVVGGVFLGFGARWADGCTSGHGISGTMQLALSSWITALCFFAGGIATAYILFEVF